MSELRQRTPRVRDESYLKKLRAAPCLKCGLTPCREAAHLRMAGPGKENPGMGNKPDDCWALPLCHDCHMIQHGGNELQFWHDVGINNPIALCRALYQLRDNQDALCARVWAHVDDSPWV